MKSNTDVINEHDEVPCSFSDSLNKNSKNKWVCETTKILDMQSIPWSPVSKEPLMNAIDAFNYGNGVVHDPILLQDNVVLPGKVFVNAGIYQGENIFTDVAVFKGDIKWKQHYKYIKSKKNYELISDEYGDVLLMINALLCLHFSKYSGIINIQTIGKNIIGINLFVNDDIIDQYPENWANRIVRIYNNRHWGK